MCIRDRVDCIIAMPTQLFYTTQIPVSLWFISKNKKQKGKTLFIDARKLGTMVTRKLRELTDEDIKKIADTYNAFADGTLEAVSYTHLDGKDVDEMSFFGRLFDFNRDGETDFSEELLGLGMIAAVAGAAEEEDQLRCV